MEVKKQKMIPEAIEMTVESIKGDNKNGDNRERNESIFNTS